MVKKIAFVKWVKEVTVCLFLIALSLREQIALNLWVQLLDRISNFGINFMWTNYKNSFKNISILTTCKIHNIYKWLLKNPCSDQEEIKKNLMFDQLVGFKEIFQANNFSAASHILSILVKFRISIRGSKNSLSWRRKD